MIIISKLQSIENNIVQIPDPIWDMLGFTLGLRVHLAVAKTDAQSESHEIICSPIPHALWHECWLLRVSMMDRPGILAELTELLRDLKIDIISCRAEGVELKGIVNIDMQLSTQFYKPDFGAPVQATDSGAGPTLPEVKARIAAVFIEDVLFPFGGKPLLSLRRILPLRRASQNIVLRESTELGDKAVPISPDFVSEIQKAALKNIGNHHGVPGRPLVSVRGDTEAGILRLVIIFSRLGYAAFRVKAHNHVGTLAHISASLREHDFNVCEMYTRNIGDGNFSITDCLIHNIHGPFVGIDATILEKILHQILSQDKSQVVEFELLWSGDIL